MSDYYTLTEKEVIEELFDCFFVEAGQRSLNLDTCISVSMWLSDKYREILAREDDSE